MTTHSIVMLGATGAVGGETLSCLMKMPNVTRLSLLGRRPVENIKSAIVEQHKIDIFNPQTYDGILTGHHTAICTLGVGQPTKVTKEDFVKIDKVAVLDFAAACKRAGVKHFQLLSSVAADSASRSFFLRTKGELEDGLRALNFDRLSLFHPSMILTPSNRYGFSQALTLAVWPLLKPLLFGPMRKYRGVKVEDLGAAFATNVGEGKTGEETLHWDEITALAHKS